MRTHCARIATALVVVGVGACATVQRQGLFTSAEESRDEEGDEAPSSQFYTLGTLLGVGFLPHHNNDIYELRDNVVVLQEHRTAHDTISPIALALPSVSLVGKPGGSLSLIAPIGINGGKSTTLGIGMSVGFNIKGGFEVGIAIAGLYSPEQELNSQQRSSYENGTQLDAADQNIDNENKWHIGIGLYISPIILKK